jgi:hypothetical protein
LPVIGFDALPSVEGEATVVFAGVHGLGFSLVQQSAPHEKTDDALSDPSLHENAGEH